VSKACLRCGAEEIRGCLVIGKRLLTPDDARVSAIDARVRSVVRVGRHRARVAEARPRLGLRGITIRLAEEIAAAVEAGAIDY
jgi:hypothetical protein